MLKIWMIMCPVMSHQTAGKHAATQTTTFWAGRKNESFVPYFSTWFHPCDIGDGVTQVFAPLEVCRIGCSYFEAQCTSTVRSMRMALKLTANGSITHAHNRRRSSAAKEYENVYKFIKSFILIYMRMVQSAIRTSLSTTKSHNRKHSFRYIPYIWVSSMTNRKNYTLWL